MKLFSHVTFVVYGMYIFVQIWQKPVTTHKMERLTFHHHSISMYINELTIHVCIIANGFLVCFSWDLFLGAVWNAQMLGWSSNGSSVTGQAFTQLEITIQLARELGHQIVYHLWYLGSNQPQIRPSGSVQLVCMKKPATSWFLTTPTSIPM